MKKENGITLVALVISIIVLLILATVSIQVLTGDNGLLNKAELATENYSESEIEEQIKLTYQEWKMGKFTDNSLNMKEFFTSTLNDIFGQENIDISGTKILTIKIANNNKEYEFIVKDDGTVNIPKDWTDNGDETYTKGNVTLKIGDYINYKEPENLEYTGSWRVLGFENGQIKLMSSENVDTLTLTGREGYQTGINQLNTICEGYADETYSSYARSIKMDDICELAGYDKTTYVDPYNGYPSYGDTYKYKLTDKGIYYEDTDGNSDIVTSIKKFINIDGTELDKNQEISITSNYYGRNSLGLSGKKYNMIFNVNYTDSISYWTADQYVLPQKSSGYADWSLMYIHPAGISFDTRYPLWTSSKGGMSRTFGVRAVVYLKPFIEIDIVNGQKDGTTAELAYEIK